ncbi:hypothetical protein POM88_048286 [Heracleum sosnowskyi]|uniref:Uncharacterized protein n=1 Tax=Heracleum sosnowskyi TaxID=360622 RepID=A0AAD8GW38_9APIA|nr:hypothetical protein POM88_048286 [Heracleum sosnowskyi]
MATRKSEVLHIPKKRPTIFRTYSKRNKVQRGRGASEEQEPPTITTGHLNEVEDVMRGREVIPLEISSDEEDMKPIVDRLLWSEPVSSRNSHTKIPLDKRREAAAVLKDSFVSNLEMNGHQMSIALIVKRADDCFTGLRSLYVDFQPFHAQVLKLINSYRKLKQLHNGKNPGVALDLESAYEMSVLAANDAEEELHTAEHQVINAQTKFEKTIEKIENIQITLHILEGEKTVARDELESSTTKRKHCNEAYLLAQKSVEEIGAKLEGCKTAIEEIQGTLGRLREL